MEMYARPSREVYGPCPGCGDWQVEVDLSRPEDRVLLEEAIVEHALTGCPALVEHVRDQGMLLLLGMSCD